MKEQTPGTPEKEIAAFEKWKTFLAYSFALLFFGMVGSGIGSIWGETIFWLKMLLTAFVLLLVTMLLYTLVKEVIKDETAKEEPVEKIYWSKFELAKMLKSEAKHEIVIQGNGGSVSLTAWHALMNGINELGSLCPNASVTIKDFWVDGTYGGHIPAVNGVPETARKLEEEQPES